MLQKYICTIFKIFKCANLYGYNFLTDGQHTLKKEKKNLSKFPNWEQKPNCEIAMPVQKSAATKIALHQDICCSLQQNRKCLKFFENNRKYLKAGGSGCAKLM